MLWQASLKSFLCGLRRPERCENALVVEEGHSAYVFALTLWPGRFLKCFCERSLWCDGEGQWSLLALPGLKSYSGSILCQRLYYTTAFIVLRTQFCCIFVWYSFGLNIYSIHFFKTFFKIIIYRLHKNDLLIVVVPAFIVLLIQFSFAAFLSFFSAWIYILSIFIKQFFLIVMAYIRMIYWLVLFTLSLSVFIVFQV